MNLNDVVEYVVVHGVTMPKKQVSEVAHAVLNAISELAVNAPVRTPIGTFKLVLQPEKQLKNNLAGGKIVTVPARSRLKFKPKIRR